MSRKVGPLPLWGWALAIGAGLIGLYLYRKHAGAAGGPTDLPDLPSGARKAAGAKAVPHPVAGRAPGMIYNWPGTSPGGRPTPRPVPPPHPPAPGKRDPQGPPLPLDLPPTHELPAAPVGARSKETVFLAYGVPDEG